MMIEWFNAGPAVKFGESLADFFIQRIPLPSENKKLKNLDKQFEVVDKMCVRIEQFKAHNKLNVYKKAKLVDTFKSRLVEAGYDPNFVDRVAMGIIQAL